MKRWRSGILLMTSRILRSSSRKSPAFGGISTLVIEPHDLVVGLRERAAEQAFLVALAAHADDHVEALAPLRDELRDQLDRVLEVAVDRDHGLRRVAWARPADSATSLPKLRASPTTLMRGSCDAAAASMPSVPSRLPSLTKMISNGLADALEDRDDRREERRDVPLLVVGGRDDREGRRSHSDRSISRPARWGAITEFCGG